jgi:ribose transport system substrate-binding protein
MKTSRLAFVALAATIGLAAAASASKAADPKEHYGMVVFLKGSEFFNWAYAGFQDEAATLGATTELQGPADWDASAEARAVDQLVAKGVKGVAVTAGDADTLTASIDAGMKAKVPVLTFDSDSPKSHRLLFVGTNNYNAGYQPVSPSPSCSATRRASAFRESRASTRSTIASRASLTP